jgi:hypothetical protein
MAVESANDLLIMLSDFGVNVTFTPDGDSPTTVKVIMDQEYYEVPGDTVGINSTQPVLYGRAIDIKTAAYGDQFDVPAITDLNGNVIKNAASYKVTSVQPDNQGIVAIALTEMTTVVTLNGEDINVTDLSEQFIEVE